MTQTDRLSEATLKQKQLEALALRLAEHPFVVEARARALRCFSDHPYAQTPDGAASMQDAADQHFFGALQLATNLDPYHPAVSSLFMYEHETDGQTFPSSLHGGLENPDNVYRLAPIAPDSTYELRGKRFNPAPAQVTYELMDSVPGLNGIGAQLGLLTDEDMALEADGVFTITLGPEPAAGRANHIQTPPEARAIFVRDTMSDWSTQTPDMLRMHRVSGPRKSPWTEEDYAAKAAELAPHYAQFWNAFRDGFVKKMAFKTNAFDPPAKRTGAWGYIANTHFKINPDQAFIFTAQPGDAPYHAVLIGNHWWISMDAARRSGAFNTSQAKRNDDGSITYVIAREDPGCWNWLDTGGLHEGIIQVRWQGGSAGSSLPDNPIRDVALVELSELKMRLPAETVWVDEAARKRQLEARFQSYCRRLDQP